MFVLKLIGFIIVMAALASWIAPALMRFFQHREKFPLAQITIGLILFILYATFQSAIGTVDPGHRGVVVRLGAVTERILPEGVFMVVPVVDSVKELSVQTHAFSAEAAAASFDLQNVHTTVTLNYFLDSGRVNWVYQNLRED